MFFSSTSVSLLVHSINQTKIVKWCCHLMTKIKKNLYKICCLWKWLEKYQNIILSFINNCIIFYIGFCMLKNVVTLFLVQLR